MFGKKKNAKDYQKMVKERKSKEYFDYYDDYFEGDEIEDDEIEDEAYYEEDPSYEESRPEKDDPDGFYEDEYYPEDHEAEAEYDGEEESAETDAYEEELPAEEDGFDVDSEDEDDFDYDPDEEEESAEEGWDEEEDTDEDDDPAYGYDPDDEEDYDARHLKRAETAKRSGAGYPKGRVKKKAGLAGIFAARFRNMSGVDWVVAFMGICILIIALIAGVIYYDSRMVAMQVAAFAEIGTELDNIDIIGESGLLAVGAMQQEKLQMDFEEPEEEFPDEQQEEEEEDINETVTVVLKVTSIQSDIKIKFINKLSEKLIGGVPFKVHVKGDNGKEFALEDDDKDGIIYRTEIANGTYKITVDALSGALAEKYDLPTDAASVKVTDTIAYKKVDVKEEIKNESQVNAAAEDTAVQDTVVESVLQDTVEWVESTKTPIETETVYEEVKDSDIAKPTVVKTVEKSDVSMPFANAEPMRDMPESKVLFAEEKPMLISGLFDAEIEVNRTIRLSASMSDGSSIFWSSDSECVSVDSTGLVTGRSVGAATVIARSEVTGESASCTITVKVGRDEPEEPSEQTLKLDPSSLTIKVGDSDVITLIMTNINTKDEIEWSSSDTSVATVSEGTVTAVEKGTAIITATLKGTEISDSCTVKVVDEKSDGGDSSGKISLNVSEVSLTVGAEVTVEATVENSDDIVVWKSSDENVASVKDGTIKGLKKGTATVTASLKSDESISASCTVTVTEDEIDLTAPLKDKEGNQLYVKKGDGTYREATAADYLKDKMKFYRKVSKDTGYRYTGWQTIDGFTYFFDKDGNYVTGEQVIQGAKYKFGSDGRLSSGSGTMGIDVSKWNGDINWNEVKKSGVSFVIIRCGYRGSSTGAMIEDPKFRTNIKGAKAAGLNVGVYFFTQAVNEVEAVEEASMALSLIGEYGVNLPVYLDVEGSGGRGDRIDAGTRTAVCKAFCATVQNSGYKAGVYANKTWLTSYINASALTGYKIWLAQYAAAPTYSTTRYDMWQYTSKGSVAGISGNVDMNILYN